LSEIHGRLDVYNDATLPLLAQQAVSHARAGSDMIAPSGMIDGMVGAIREGLDGAGFPTVPIMSYAAKYASGYYGSPLICSFHQREESVQPLALRFIEGQLREERFF
jgi:delta-aminolevulinic acid dehydratase/porphobilinogen synthase